MLVLFPTFYHILYWRKMGILSDVSRHLQSVL